MAKISRGQARQRAAVLVAMLVQNQMQDCSKITRRVEELLDRRGVNIASTLHALKDRGLVSRREHLGEGHKPGNQDWWQLTDAGRYAAEIAQGLMD